MQRAFLNEHGGDRAASAIQLRLDNRAARGPRRVGFELHHIGLQQNHFEQLVDSDAGAGRDRHGDDVAAVVFRHQADLGEALLDVVEVGVGQIDFVDRDDYRNVGGTRVVDRLLRLRHHALVGGDHQHDDVGDLGAARAHRSERLMAGGIDERDSSAVGLDGVRADVLRDTAELARRHVGVANRVEQRGLAVIDVAHHGDYRRPRDHLARDHFFWCLFDDLFGVEGYILDAVAELAGEQRGGVDVEHLVERRHLAELHQFLDQVAGLDAHRAPEVADGDALGDTDDALGGLGRRDLGLALFLAGESAALLRHTQPAHLALGGEVGAALLDDLLFLDSAAGARLISRELVGGKLRSAVPRLCRLRLRREASCQTGPRTRRARRGTGTGRRGTGRRRLRAQIDLAENLGSLLSVVESRAGLRTARQVDRATVSSFRRTHTIRAIAETRRRRGRRRFRCGRGFDDDGFLLGLGRYKSGLGLRFLIFGMDGGLGQMGLVVSRTNFFDFGLRLDDGRRGRAMRLRWRRLGMMRIEHDRGFGLRG